MPVSFRRTTLAWPFEMTLDISTLIHYISISSVQLSVGPACFPHILILREVLSLGLTEVPVPIVRTGKLKIRVESEIQGIYLEEVEFEPGSVRL